MEDTKRPMEAKFQCQICGSGFDTIAEARNHYRSSHGTGTTTTGAAAPKCGSDYVAPVSKASKKPKVCHCPRCFQEFTEKGSLPRHAARQHPNLIFNPDGTYTDRNPSVAAGGKPCPYPTAEKSADSASTSSNSGPNSHSGRDRPTQDIVSTSGDHVVRPSPEHDNSEYFPSPVVPKFRTSVSFPAQGGGGQPAGGCARVGSLKEESSGSSYPANPVTAPVTEGSVGSAPTSLPVFPLPPSRTTMTYWQMPAVGPAPITAHSSVANHNSSHYGFTCQPSMSGGSTSYVHASNVEETGPPHLPQRTVPFSHKHSPASTSGVPPSYPVLPFHNHTQSLHMEPTPAMSPSCPSPAAPSPASHDSIEFLKAAVRKHLDEAAHYEKEAAGHRQKAQALKGALDAMEEYKYNSGTTHHEHM